MTGSKISCDSTLIPGCRRIYMVGKSTQTKKKGRGGRRRTLRERAVGPPILELRTVDAKRGQRARRRWPRGAVPSDVMCIPGCRCIYTDGRSTQTKKRGWGEGGRRRANIPWAPRFENSVPSTSTAADARNVDGHAEQCQVT